MAAPRPRCSALIGERTGAARSLRWRAKLALEGAFSLLAESALRGTEPAELQAARGSHATCALRLQAAQLAGRNAEQSDKEREEVAPGLALWPPALIGRPSSSEREAAVSATQLSRLRLHWRRRQQQDELEPGAQLEPGQLALKAPAGRPSWQRADQSGGSRLPSSLQLSSTCRPVSLAARAGRPLAPGSTGQPQLAARSSAAQHRPLAASAQPASSSSQGEPISQLLST